MKYERKLLNNKSECDVLFESFKVTPQANLSFSMILHNHKEANKSVQVIQVYLQKEFRTLQYKVVKAVMQISKAYYFLCIGVMKLSL